MSEGSPRAHPTPRLWLARHAQPLIEPGICYGQLDMEADPALTQASAEALHAVLPHALAEVRISPLRRCRQLAQALCAHRPQANALSDARIQEMGFGDWEGQAWNDIPREAIDAWTHHFSSHPPGNGESLEAMLARVKVTLEASSHIARQSGQDVLWITHAGVIRCVLWLHQHGDRMPASEEWTLPAPRCGEWRVLPLGNC